MLAPSSVPLLTVSPTTGTGAGTRSLASVDNGGFNLKHPIYHFTNAVPWPRYPRKTRSRSFQRHRPDTAKNFIPSHRDHYYKRSRAWRNRGFRKNKFKLKTSRLADPIEEPQPPSDDDDDDEDSSYTDTSTFAVMALMVESDNTTEAEEMSPCIDTGATNHFMPCRDEYLRALVPESVRTCSTVVSTAGLQSSTISKCMGDMWIQSPTVRHPPILLRDVLMVENFRRGLVSASSLCLDGYTLAFDVMNCRITNSQGSECMVLDRRNALSGTMSKLYLLPSTYFIRHPSHEACLASTYSGNSASDWHRRMGHNSMGRKSMADFFRDQGIKTLPQHDDCADCTQAKIHHTAYPKRNLVNAEFCGQSFSVDFAGPYRTASPFSEKYMCILVDVKSRHITCIGARLKSELTKIIEDHIAMVERVQQPHTVVFVVSDGALSDKELIERLRTRGITILIVAPGASCLNSLVERRIRTVTESGRAMNIAAGLPPTHFITACKYATIIQNHIPNQGTDVPKADCGRNLCPQEMWSRRDFGSYLKLFRRFRVYGCLAFVLHRFPNKQVSKAERAVFLGFAPNNPKAYLLLSLERNKHVISRDVVCHELQMPFKKAYEINVPMPVFTSEDHGRFQDNNDVGDVIKPAPAPVEEHFEQQAGGKYVGGQDHETQDYELDSGYSVNKLSESTSDTIQGKFDTSDSPSEPLQPPTRAQVSPTHIEHKSERPTNQRLSFDIPASPAPVNPTLANTDTAAKGADQSNTFALRKQLGTGDEAPGPRGKRARHLTVGATYHNRTFDIPCTVQEINGDGDVQITFPNSTEEDPNTLYTADQEEIGPLEDYTSEANQVEVMQQMPHSHPLVESNDGEFFSSGEFTAELLDPHEAFQAERSRRPMRDWKLGKGKERGTRITPSIVPTLLKDLVGKVPADMIDVPRTHYEIRNSALRPLIEDAQHRELDLLITKGVFRHAHTRLASDVVIPTMFVNKAKGDVDGNLLKIKARLTLRGDLDKKGKARQTYAPVPPISSMRLLIALHCNDLDTQFMQVDYEAAFVTAKVTRRIVISLPTGYHGPGTHVTDPVHVLNFNLYGGDDAPLVYQNDMISKHRNIGFNSVPSEHCYLEMHHDNDFIKMIFHVDDFLIAYRGDTLWQWYLSELSKLYKFTAAPLTHYLGMRFNRQPDGHFVIDQEAQVDKMCRAFNLVKGSEKFPNSPILAFSEADRPKLADLPTTDEEKAVARKIPYREAVGHLSYLAQTTHFEIALPVRIASSFCSGWGNKQWMWVKNIMRFLQSKTTKYTYIRGGGSEHLAWSDSDHAGNPDNRRSMAAFMSYYGNDLIDWYAKLERIVAHSSAESELMALDAIARQTQHTRWKLTDFGFPPLGPTIIHMDSSSAIQMAENPIQNSRNRHIHARYFYVRDLIHDGSIILRKVPTELNRADMLATYKDVNVYQQLLQMCKPQLDEPPPAPTAVVEVEQAAA